MITGFMKMLDPGSVVRETEFATARDTAGLFERLTNEATKIAIGTTKTRRNSAVKRLRSVRDTSIWVSI